MLNKITRISIIVSGILIILFISGCPGSEVTEYFEDFNDGVADNFVDDGTGRMSVENQAYQMTGQGTDTLGYSYYNRVFTDFTYSIDLRQPTGTDTPPFGVFFRSPAGDSNQDAYIVVITLASANWCFGKMVDGSFSFISPAYEISPDLNPGIGSTNTVEVVCAGSDITVSFNGQVQGTWTDTTFTSGYCGVTGDDPSAYSSISYTFDNFFIDWD